MARQDFWYNPEAKKAGLPPTGTKGGGYIWLSSQTAVDLETGAITRDLEDLPKEGYEQLHTGNMIYDGCGRGPIRAQTWRIYDNLRKILSQQKASLNDIVRQRIYLCDIETTGMVEKEMLAFFPVYKPATCIWRMNDRGLKNDIHIMVEVVAIDPKSGLKAEGVYVPELARWTAPYPQAVKVGQFLWSSALYGIDPDTGRVPMSRADLPADIPQLWADRYYYDANAEAAKAQLAQLYRNLDRFMTSQGAAMRDVGHILQWFGCGIKYLGDIQDMRIKRYWPDPKDCPTPSGFHLYPICCDRRIQWSIDMQGLLPGPIHKVPTMVPDRGVGDYYALHTRMGPLWFNAGEIPGEKSTRKAYFEFSELPGAARFLAQGRVHSHQAMVQAWFLYQVLLKRVLQDDGLDFSKVVMQQIYMHDVSEYPAIERVAQLAFDGNMPATSVVCVDDLTAFLEDGLIEVEFICETT